MILFELTQTEDHPLYQDLEIANGNRQYDFLRSIVITSINAKKVFLSQHVIKALNFQAITCLHTNPGEYRPCNVSVGVGAGKYEPPPPFRVQALMDDFVNTVNRNWEGTDAIVLAAYALWRLNHIHPFINGNGRTARAACYFVLCLRAGYWLPGETILPELIRRERVRYVEALKEVDASFEAGKLDLTALHSLLAELVTEQLASAPADPDNPGELVPNTDAAAPAAVVPVVADPVNPSAS